MNPVQRPLENVFKHLPIIMDFAVMYLTWLETFRSKVWCRKLECDHIWCVGARRAVRYVLAEGYPLAHLSVSLTLPLPRLTAVISWATTFLITYATFRAQTNLRDRGHLRRHSARKESLGWHGLFNFTWFLCPHFVTRPSINTRHLIVNFCGTGGNFLFV